MNTERFKSTIDTALAALQSVVDSGYTIKQDDTYDQWRLKYESLVMELQKYRDECSSLYKEHRDTGLTVNGIEAEGALRSAVTVCSIVDMVEGWYNDGTIGNDVE